MNNYSITENITQNLRLKPMKACASEDFCS